ncbi:MAG: hypothetical protein J6W41_03405 [Alphaproteobacteria bacterium]|nr:hypothetical protein [Alphaproteobacteria bacterium]
MNMPKDWSNLSNEETLKYINYLKKHSYKYKITVDDMGEVMVKYGADIIANVDYAVTHGSSCVTINRKEIYIETPLYDEAYWLYGKLNRKAQPFKAKVKKWWEQEQGKVIALTVFAVFIGGMSFLITKTKEDNKREKEQFKQEIIKEALEKFKQEQQKMNTIIQYPMQKVK